MTNPLIGIDGIVREMNEEELENHLITQSQSDAIDEKRKAREDARESALAKLAALGLTEEEIAAL
jgi:DNA-binding NarL/FixJ family response regulator